LAVFVFFVVNTRSPPDRTTKGAHTQSYSTWWQREVQALQGLQCAGPQLEDYVDLDILYAKLVGAPDDDNEDNSSESDGGAMSDEGEMDDINFPAAAVPSDPVRKRSRSHELAVITSEATGGAPLRRTRGNK
jgi:hypothetical protein